MTTYSPNGPGVDQVLSEAEVTQFFDQGYVVLKGAADAQEVEAYGRAVLGLLPRDLTVPEDWHANAGRFKPFRKRSDGSRDDCIDIPELLPLFCNRRLYEAAAQLLGSPRVRIYDGSVGITMRNQADVPPRSQTLHVDASVPIQVDDFSDSQQELQVGGCLYLTDVLPDGGGSTSSLAATVGYWRPPRPTPLAAAISTRIGNAFPTRSPWKSPGKRVTSLCCTTSCPTPRLTTVGRRRAWLCSCVTYVKTTLTPSTTCRRGVTTKHS